MSPGISPGAPGASPQGTSPGMSPGAVGVRSPRGGVGRGWGWGRGRGRERGRGAGARGRPRGRPRTAADSFRSASAHDDSLALLDPDAAALQRSASLMPAAPNGGTAGTPAAGGMGGGIEEESFLDIVNSLKGETGPGSPEVSKEALRELQERTRGEPGFSGAQCSEIESPGTHPPEIELPGTQFLERGSPGNLFPVPSTPVPQYPGAGFSGTRIPGVCLSGTCAAAVGDSPQPHCGDSTSQGHASPLALKCNLGAPVGTLPLRAHLPGAAHTPAQHSPLQHTQLQHTPAEHLGKHSRS